MPDPPTDEDELSACADVSWPAPSARSKFRGRGAGSRREESRGVTDESGAKGRTCRRKQGSDVREHSGDFLPWGDGDWGAPSCPLPRPGPSRAGAPAGALVGRAPSLSSQRGAERAARPPPPLPPAPAGLQGRGRNRGPGTRQPRGLTQGGVRCAWWEGAAAGPTLPPETWRTQCWGGHRARRAARGRPRRGPPGDSPRVRATPRREGRSDARCARAAGHGTSPVHGEVGPALPRPTTYRLWLHRREPPPSADPRRTARGPGVPQPVSHTATSSPVTPSRTPSCWPGAQDWAGPFLTRLLPPRGAHCPPGCSQGPTRDAPATAAGSVQAPTPGSEAA